MIFSKTNVLVYMYWVNDHLYSDYNEHRLEACFRITVHRNYHLGTAAVRIESAGGVTYQM